MRVPPIPDADPQFPAADADPEFVRARHGRVHVVGYPEALDRDYTMAELLLLGPIPTRCGKTLRQHIGGQQQNAYKLEEFPDEELCTACYRSVPESEQHRLFEHGQVEL